MRKLFFASGMALLAASLIDQMQFDAMPRGTAPGNGNRRKPRSKYHPHQGKQEIARRLRQMEARNGR